MLTNNDLQDFSEIEIEENQEIEETQETQETIKKEECIELKNIKQC